MPGPPPSPGPVPGSGPLPPPPVRPLLPRGEVHGWFFALGRFAARDLAPWLSPDEIGRAGRFAFERDRDGFVVGRGVLRALLAAHLGAEPGALRFRLGEAGKPALRDAGDLVFNLSHSHGFALVAIGRGSPIGVDLERVREIPERDALVASHFAPEERAAFAALPPAERTRAFHAGWTRKEAVIKATGEGLGRDLASFAVSLSPGPGAVPLLRFEGEAASRWSLLDLELGPGFAAALARRGPAPIWRLRGFSPP